MYLLNSLGPFFDHWCDVKWNKNSSGCKLNFSLQPKRIEIKLLLRATLENCYAL